ncbi:7886_t:CDS:2, partial [Scutellospora calospora]
FISSVQTNEIRTLFVSKSGLETSKKLIDDYNSGKLKDVNSKSLWKAKKKRLSIPDTGEPIFLPFRMSCFVPTNLVVVA